MTRIDVRLGWRLITLVLGLILLAPGMATAQDENPADAPADGQPLPNAERPLTQAELLDVRGEWAQGHQGAQMLVADAVIDRSSRLRGKSEAGGRDRAFGSLQRDEYPGDPVVQARTDVQALYPTDDSPVSGLLAIDLAARSMELRGSVAMPDGTYLTPIDPSAMAVANQLPEGSLIAVRGWLSRLDQLEPCPAFAEVLDPNDSGGRSSPFVRCPGGWITTGEITEPDSEDPLAPTTFGIPVQHGALETFAEAHSGGPIVQPASYVLRLVANPIEGAEPATGWQVIGRLDVPTQADVPPAPPPDEAVTPTGLNWEAGLERQPPADSWWTHTTAWDGGFASVHVGRDRVMSSWVSPDGRTWQGASLPRGIDSVRALVRLEHGLALIANERPFDKVWRFDVWRSNDGLTWRRVGRHRVRPPARFAESRRLVQGYWALQGRIVALETYTTLGCCGRIDRGSVFLAASNRQTDVTYTWSSSNGRTWTRRRTSGIPPLTSGYFGFQVEAGEDELLVEWRDPNHTIGRTTDGVRWKTAGSYPDDLDPDNPSVIARTPDGFVLAGAALDSQPRDGSDLTIWTSTPNGAWERTYERPNGIAGSIAVVGEAVIIAGESRDRRHPSVDSPPRLPWLLSSDDGGRTWDADLAWADDAEWCLRSLTTRTLTPIAGSVMLEAICAPPDAASTYVVTLDSGAPASVATVPTPREALRCERKRGVRSIRDAWRGTAGHRSPESALTEVLEDDFVIPVQGYDELARDRAGVLYGFRHRDKVKVAIRVESTGSGGWIPEWLADCGVAEYGRKAEMGPGVWLWANREGRTIVERRGPAHCRQQSIRFLWLSSDAAKRTGEAIFVRDPEGQFRDQWQAPYLRSTSLPANARNTGYRRDGATIWTTPGRDSIYIRNGKDVQRWPRIPRSAIDCA